MPKPSTKAKTSKKAKPVVRRSALRNDVSAAAGTSRQIRPAPYRPWRRRKGPKPIIQPVTGAFKLFARSLQILVRNWRLFLGILAVYALLNLILVHGLASNGNLSTIKDVLTGAIKGTNGQVVSGLTLFIYLLGGSSNASSSNADAGVYQTLLIILMSLVLIWSLRQVYAHVPIRVRDSFYKGIYPFVQFILVLLVVGLQLLPVGIGAFVYSTVVSTGIAVGGFETFLWGALFFVLACSSFYMLCSSVFALYIVTLPDMTPMKALRSARELVRYRRWVVFRKLLFLPIASLILTAAIMLPVIIFVTAAAEWVYFILTIIGLAVIHSYLYGLYRELLPHE